MGKTKNSKQNEAAMPGRAHRVSVGVDESWNSMNSSLESVTSRICDENEKKS